MSPDVTEQSAESRRECGVSALLVQILIFLITVPRTFGVESIKTDANLRLMYLNYLESTFFL